jgi:hypothetical protein
VLQSREHLSNQEHLVVANELVAQIQVVHDGTSHIRFWELAHDWIEYHRAATKRQGTPNL